MRGYLVLLGVAACDGAERSAGGFEDLFDHGDPCGGDRPLDELCAGSLRLDLDEDGALVLTVVDPLVIPTAVYMDRLVSCDETESRNEDVWQVKDLGTTLIAEGLRYGEPPPGSTELQAPLPLVDGEAYVVSLRRDGRRSESWDVWYRHPDLGSAEPVATVCPSWWAP